jgi:hypothetical protein
VTRFSVRRPAQIVTTTLPPHPTNAFDVMPLLVPAIREFAANR